MNKLVANSIFGQIDRNAKTTDGFNVGEMQDEMSKYVDGIMSRIPVALTKMSALDAKVAIVQAFEQGVVRMWGSNEIEVLHNDGRMQGVNARDISEMLERACK